MLGAIVGFLIAPMAGLFLFFIGFFFLRWLPLMPPASAGDLWRQPLAFLLTSFGLAYSLTPISYPTAILLGLPTLLLFRRLRISHWAAYLVAGLVIGLVAGWFLRGRSLADLSLGFGPGALAMLVYWAIAVRARPAVPPPQR
jgi:hypothetical protein